MLTALLCLFAVVALVAALHAEVRLYQTRRLVRESLIATRDALMAVRERTHLQDAMLDTVFGELHEIWGAITDDEDDEEDDDAGQPN